MAAKLDPAGGQPASALARTAWPALLAAGTLGFQLVAAPPNTGAPSIEARAYLENWEAAAASWHGAPQTAPRAPMTVEQLRGLTGLSASQIGRLFGVSRRSVNNWLVGNPMAPHHQERLSELEETLMSVAGTTPEQRRAALLDSSRGTSLFHQLVGQVREDAVIHAAPLAAREQL